MVSKAFVKSCCKFLNEKELKIWKFHFSSPHRFDFDFKNATTEEFIQKTVQDSIDKAYDKVSIDYQFIIEINKPYTQWLHLKNAFFAEMILQNIQPFSITQLVDNEKGLLIMNLCGSVSSHDNFSHLL